MDGHRAIGESVLDQLAGINPERPRADNGEVAGRLQDYVRALGLPTPRVRFASDLRALRLARVYPGTDRSHWQSFMGRQWWLLDQQTESRWRWGHRGREIVRPRMDDERPKLHQIITADRSVLEVGLGSSRYVRGVRHVATSLERIARVLAEGGTAAPPRRVDALVPLAEAAASGLFAYSVGAGGAGDLVALVRPRMRFDREGRLHDWDGRPAAEWPNGRGLYFWRGVEMTESVGRFPERVTPARIAGWSNTERRRVAIERIGLRRFVIGVGATVIQEDDYGRLWQTGRDIGGAPYVAVEVVNATVESDGSYGRYFLRVPPSVRTARHAVAWTFSLTAMEYKPAVES